MVFIMKRLCKTEIEVGEAFHIPKEDILLIESIYHEQQALHIWYLREDD